jgi:hypothetical protein
MSSNQFESYYVNQAGTGISGFSGVRYQKGHGFFGRILSGAVLPILKYLGKKALGTGVNIGTDLLQGENIKTSMKKRLKTAGFNIAEDAFEKLKNYKQEGSGRKRRKSRKKQVKRKKSKRKPSVLQLKALAKGRLSLKYKRKRNSSNRFKKRKNNLFF